jgi:hypothetical protein
MEQIIIGLIFLNAVVLLVTVRTLLDAITILKKHKQ